ncbi:hypothetical protein [Bartonella krasnovii]|uniref:Phage protein n=1 Tax=Bartonella krasnovii TaxID=2267275 RepID=A0ABY3VVD3_9HYPH|nr:hypothetical protein [Bartonella krasnovii]UNF29342.1 hypothetical protein MNL13_00715 [Bartonella krasnovii]UNF35699.1 hypothetical protein MNL12_00715 [Bartonella krasnovii]UNF37320.1 hypothetical protein MNL11_00730 [Bartonella krasnovii]UNF39012.1 hypothetical protein MNL10_00710 [Bartonella krasnovii]UNF40744.1 hypothetical protein MNL09_00715 [Bartonella krasnovii]
MDLPLYPSNERWCEIDLRTLRNISYEENTAHSLDAIAISCPHYRKGKALREGGLSLI